MPKNIASSLFPKDIVPSLSLIPQLITIFLAIDVSLSISLLAPVDIELKVTSSAILPPSITLIIPKRWSFVSLYLSSLGSCIVTPNAIPLGIIETLCTGSAPTCYNEARKIIEDNRLLLAKTAEALLEKETIETSELKELVKEYAAEGYKDNMFSEKEQEEKEETKNENN